MLSAFACRFYFAAFIAAGLASFAAAEEAPLNATVFFSEKDPHWPAAQTLIDGVARSFPKLKLSKISIDDDAGYLKLSETEQKLRILEPGDLTVAFESFALVSKDGDRGVENYFSAVVERLHNPGAGKGRAKVDLAAYVSGKFGKDASFSESSTSDANTRYYPVMREGKRAGWAVDVFAPIACPVCNDVHFLMAVSLPGLTLVDVTPVRELERYGKRLEPGESAGFLKKIVAGQSGNVNVDAITGATKTSHHYAAALNAVLQELRKEKKP